MHIDTNSIEDDSVMNSVMSRNQLASWDFHSMSEDKQLESYFECLVECDDSAHVCKRVCREVLSPPH